MPKLTSDKSGRAPAIDVLSQHYLARGLMKHPDVGEYVADVNEIEDMPMLALLRLAQRMGVDADTLIEATERAEEACRRYSHEHPAFVGRIEFDLTVEVFGKRVTRKAHADYSYTPEWEYWDLNKGAPFEGWPGSAITVEARTVPKEDGSVGPPRWEQIEIPEIGEVWNAIEEAIDAKCKVDDEERRRAAARDAASPARRNRARH
jgi:hypothetical protein